MEPVRLTPRQHEVLELLAKRRSNQEIADKLGISLDGAKWHVREVLQIYGVGSREEAAERFRIEHGLPRRLWRMTWSAVNVALVLGAAVLALVVAAVLIGVNLRGDEEQPAANVSPAASATSATVPTSTTTPGATVSAPSRATGQAFLDSVTSRLESGVPIGRTDLAGQNLPCLNKSFLGDTNPGCPSGAADGTLVLSIITFACEIEWIALTPDLRLTTIAGDRLALDSVLLGGAVYTRPPAVNATPDYWMLFKSVGANLPAGFAVAVKDGKVVSWGRSCGDFESLEDRLGAGAAGTLPFSP